MANRTDRNGQRTGLSRAIDSSSALLMAEIVKRLILDTVRVLPGWTAAREVLGEGWRAHALAELVDVLAGLHPWCAGSSREAPASCWARRCPTRAGAVPGSSAGDPRAGLPSLTGRAVPCYVWIFPSG
jgi:hypothetical protein